MLIDFTKPIRLETLKTKCYYMGPQTMREGGVKIQDAYKHLVLVGFERVPNYVDDAGFVMENGKRKQLVWQHEEKAEGEGKKVTAYEKMETAIMLLVDRIDHLSHAVEAQTQLLAASHTGAAPVGKPQAEGAQAALSAASAPASKPTVVKLRPAMSMEKIKLPERWDSSVLLQQCAILAGFDFVKSISPGTSNAKGTGITGWLKLAGSILGGFRVRGVLDQGDGVMDIFVHTHANASLPQLEEALGYCNDYLLETTRKGKKA